MSVNMPQTKPSLVMALAIMTLLSGIVNLVWGPVVVLGTLGLGLLCAPAMVLNVVLGAFEIAFALKLLSNPPQPVQPSQSIAIWQIVCLLTGNLFAMIVGILSLVFYNDPVVRDYFARINSSGPLPPLPPESGSPAAGPDENKRVFG
jgi:hypothetical protein